MQILSEEQGLGEADTGVVSIGSRKKLFGTKLVFLSTARCCDARKLALKERIESSIISSWRSYDTVVLSGYVTRTGPQGVGTPCGLPLFMSPEIGRAHV